MKEALNQPIAQRKASAHIASCLFDLELLNGL